MTLPEGSHAKVLRPGEGRYVVIGDRARCTFKIVGAETGGQFGLFEYVMEPKAKGATPHVHHQLTEIFYVAEGEVELILGQERHLAPCGSLMLVPPETVHGFSNASAERSTLLIMFCPAGERERYFEGMAELTRDGRVPSRAELLELMRRFDQEPVELPPD
jgi:quercetin dioxygenase-like cupin family protein